MIGKVIIDVCPSYTCTIKQQINFMKKRSLPIKPMENAFCKHESQWYTDCCNNLYMKVFLNMKCGTF